MLQKFSRIAQRTALSTLVASCLAIGTNGMAQEPFFLIPSDPAGKSGPTDASPQKTDSTKTNSPKSERPKQRTPNIPFDARGESPANEPPSIKSSLTLDEPPRLMSFPSNPTKKNTIEDDGVLILGKIEETKDGSPHSRSKKIAPITDHLPIPKSNPQVRETENAQLTKPDDAKIDVMAAIPRLSLSWQLANASSFPFSPIHLWQGIRREPISESLANDRLPSMASNRTTDADVNPDTLTEPPAFKPLALDTCGQDEATSETIADDLDPKDNSSSPQLVNSPKPEVTPKDSPVADGKPRRNVRIPFGDEEPTAGDAPNEPPTHNLTPKSLTSELEEQKGQEAPIIDVKSLDRAKDEQGADALQAAKPTTPPKRIIKIEDPQMEGQIVPAKPSDAPVIVSAADTLRLRRAQACLDHYLNFPESTSVRSPWAVMHALLPYGGDYEMIHGNQRVNAIGWMCHNGTCRTQRIFTPSRNGFIPNIGGGVQGHAGQFMAILAQCSVPLDYPIQVGNQKYKVEDLVRYEMATCREKSELTFKLIGLSYYLDSNKQWKSNDGKVWSIPKLISEELAQPIKGAACGGTHRLMGYSFAVKQRTLQGLPIDGQYARADKFVKDYVEYAWKLQNPDGSFSTSWLEGRGDEPNEERKVQTTGHILEWLLFTIPDSELNTPKVQKSVDFLLTKIYDKKEYKWPIGPRGHATRAVSLYLNRYDEIKMSKPELLRSDTKTASPRSSEPFNRR